MWKKFAVFLVLLMGSILFIPTTTALAAPELKVSVSVGLDGKAKYGKGGPLTITIENSGTAFSGDLVIDIPYTYSMGAGEAIPVDIGAGETKTMALVIQKMNDYGGMYGTPNTKNIFLYEGGWKEGKEIAHKGTQQITTTMYYEDTKFAVQFTDNVDRLAALKTVRLTNVSSFQLMNASKIGATTFPEEADGWGAVDFIVVDEYPLADLSAKQQEALVGWVRAGGIIVFGGSDNSHAESGMFADYLPLQLKGSTEVDAIILNNWAGTEDFEGVIPSYKTKLNPDAQAIFEDDHNVISAYKRVGQGLVMQTSFSVGDEPVAKMNGMTAFWNTMFETGQRTIQKNQSAHRYYDEPMDAINSIGYANELFPSFKVSAPLIFGIITFYIILIIPVLYFVLKRKDKREYTWWIIPAIAILTSIAIFGYGAKDRIGRAQIQHSAVLNVEQDGSMSGYYAESLLTNKSGDFTFAAPTGTTLFASMQMGGNPFGSSSATSLHKSTILEKDAVGSTVYLRDVGYWDVATVYGKTYIDNTGNYDIKLSVDDKQLKGSVTNGFPFALTDVAIWSGTKLISIGDLGPGETAEVNETLKTNTLLPRRSMYNAHMNLSPKTTDDLTKMRKDSLLSFSEEQMNKTRKPVLIGYADTQIIPIDLKEANPSRSSMTMIVQPAEVNVTFKNTFTVVSEMMTMSLLSEDNNFEAGLVGYPADEYYFDQAVYKQTWQLPEELMNQKLKWTSIEVSKIKKQLFDASILNVRTGNYEQIDSTKFVIDKNAADYITPEGEIVVRMVFLNGQQGNQARAPELKLIGEVAK